MKTGIRIGLIVVLLLGLFGGVMAATAATGMFPGSLLKVSSKENDTQIIKAIQREEQVVLLSLGIQGLSEKTQSSTFFGVDVPGSARASFIQYSFNAKLGVEGKAVTIERSGEKQVNVTIPQFIFIGHDKPAFKLAAETNGVLSWVTPEIDTTEMINKILNAETQNQYIEANREILRDQAKSFYTGIIAGVDPTITVTVTYS